ncbi:RNA polymerase sigma factor [Mucilaginibacter sp. UR6-11]|uniref:RNA polymerase sigma factor n=1 Tax=Mucilaginibacter sp. UR6-11 TaxID=1435644 RepID=UPI001E31CF7A|nr:sigma factor-like helix-turn-helix DNA-binding protein [Mucilaginibacter sp. UR6-11]MCC8423460.1 hypothetical protein [Mucilaginibacter sp. UR6-11]
MVKQDRALLQTKPLSVYTLYDAYAGMLLGYIFEVVKDKKLAEEYLVRTFSNVAKQFNKINWDETNNWCLLQRFAKSELSTFNDTSKNPLAAVIKKPKAEPPNKYLDQMTDEQRFIFCNIYYSSKTTAQLAKEIGKSEGLIKQLLKEAFAVIRKSNGN